MNRRSFLRKAALTAAGTIAAPYILPANTLFAPTGSRVANHVVYVLFGGGIRQQESIGRQYLADQGSGPSGNIMPNMLSGAQPSSSLIYTPWSPIGPSLSSKGTLFRNMRYASGPTGHYNGHTVALTGNYTNTSLNLNINPEFPTVFEYYRKHSDPAKNPMNCWWMSTELGPYPSLNYSRHAQYGANYGANYLMPFNGTGNLANSHFGGLQTLHPEENTRVNSVKNLLDINFNREAGAIPGIINKDADAAVIQQLYLDIMNGDETIEYPVPPEALPGDLTGDLRNIGSAWKIMEKFTPELMVINTTNSDVCHDNFSLYVQMVHKADYGIGWLWDKIQSHPVLANDTILIAMPEHGRNLQPNGLTDANGLRAYDHTSDSNSRDIFGLIVGPTGAIKQNELVGSDSNPIGESIDIVPTIAHILGFGDQIPSGFLPGRVLNEAFV